MRHLPPGAVLLAAILAVNAIAWYGMSLALFALRMIRETWRIRSNVIVGCYLGRFRGQPWQVNALCGAIIAAFGAFAVFMAYSVVSFVWVRLSYHP